MSKIIAWWFTALFWPDYCKFAFVVFYPIARSPWLQSEQIVQYFQKSSKYWVLFAPKIVSVRTIWHNFIKRDGVIFNRAPPYTWAKNGAFLCYQSLTKIVPSLLDAVENLKEVCDSQLTSICYNSMLNVICDFISTKYTLFPMRNNQPSSSPCHTLGLWSSLNRLYIKYRLNLFNTGAVWTRSPSTTVNFGFRPYQLAQRLIEAAVSLACWANEEVTVAAICRCTKAEDLEQ